MLLRPQVVLQINQDLKPEIMHFERNYPQRLDIK